MKKVFVCFFRLSGLPFVSQNVHASSPSYDVLLLWWNLDLGHLGRRHL